MNNNFNVLCVSYKTRTNEREKRLTQEQYAHKEIIQKDIKIYSNKRIVD